MLERIKVIEKWSKIDIIYEVVTDCCCCLINPWIKGSHHESWIMIPRDQICWWDLPRNGELTVPFLLFSIVKEKII